MAPAQHQAEEAPQKQTMPPAQPTPASDSSSTTTNTETGTDTQQEKTAPGGPYLPLPAPSDTPTTTTPDDQNQQQRTTQVEVNGQAISLDHLGPTVIGRDGTLGRIANWEELTEWERANTLRVLGKRNQLRLASLRSSGGDNSSATDTQ